MQNMQIANMYTRSYKKLYGQLYRLWHLFKNILFCPLFILSNVENGKNVNTKNEWQHMNIIK